MKRATICIPVRGGTEHSNAMRRRNGKPLVVATIEAAKQCERAARVMLCTDSLEVAHAAESHCSVYCCTVDHAWCGTNRIWRAFRACPEVFAGEFVVNWQLDEPFVKPADVDAAIMQCRRILTLLAPLDGDDWRNTHVVKADYLAGSVLRFSRSTDGMATPLHHVGIYVFTRTAFAELGGLTQTKRSQAERLEQLTWTDRNKIVEAMLLTEVPPSLHSDSALEKWCA